MSRLIPFELSDSVKSLMRKTKSIPARLFNREGQTIIYPKQDVSLVELEKLFRFDYQGVYYRPEDAPSFGISHPAPGSIYPVYDGLSDSLLISEKMAKTLARTTQSVFDELKDSQLSAETMNRSLETLEHFFREFEDHPDAMNGIVNVLDHLGELNLFPPLEMAVKRTVVSMAMKTRGLSLQTGTKASVQSQSVVELMASALLCDVGFTRMKSIDSQILSDEEWNYLKSHPLIGYMMVAPVEPLSARVKFNILNHHRPLTDQAHSANNYPSTVWIKEKLALLAQNSAQHYPHVAQDAEFQVSQVESNHHAENDLAILSLASEFASLTTETSWRKAYAPDRAIRMMINNSFFTHPDRNVRDFLDIVSVSLCHNRKIIQEGDYVLLANSGAGGHVHWEVAQVQRASRWQSKPGIERIATVLPHIAAAPKYQIKGIQIPTLKPVARSTHVELANDPQRRIVYALDPQHDQQQYEAVDRLRKTL